MRSTPDMQGLHRIRIRQPERRGRKRCDGPLAEDDQRTRKQRPAKQRQRDEHHAHGSPHGNRLPQHAEFVVFELMWLALVLVSPSSMMAVELGPPASVTKTSLGHWA